jgi:hypothetical protein
LVPLRLNTTPVKYTVDLTAVGTPVGVPMWAWIQTVGLVPEGMVNLFQEVLLRITPGIMHDGGVGAVTVALDGFEIRPLPEAGAVLVIEPAFKSACVIV